MTDWLSWSINRYLFCSKSSLGHIDLDQPLVLSSVVLTLLALSYENFPYVSTTMSYFHILVHFCDEIKYCFHTSRYQSGTDTFRNLWIAQIHLWSLEFHFPLFCKVFPLRFRAWLWEVLIIQHHYWVQAVMLTEKFWGSANIPVHPKDMVEVRFLHSSLSKPRLHGAHIVHRHCDAETD